MRRCQPRQARAGQEGASALTRAMVSGLGFPLIFLSLFLLVLYWFSTELGGQDPAVGEVVEGMDVVDKIKSVKTGVKAGMSDVPLETVEILSVTRAE